MGNQHRAFCDEITSSWSRSVIFVDSVAPRARLGSAAGLPLAVVSPAEATHRPSRSVATMSLRASVATLARALLLARAASASDLTLCFLPPPAADLVVRPEATSAFRARGERFDPAEAYLAAFDASRRCVPRALWDLQAAATRARARLDDPSLACEPSHTSFLCDPNLAPPNDPFACHLHDESFPNPPVDMRACVWPVCEALCVASEDESPRARARDAKRHAATCARCARACAVDRLRLADDAQPSPSAERYCDALEAQRRRLEDDGSYSHENANGREDARSAERRGERYGDAWGCPGCDAAISAAVGDGLTQASIALAASAAAQGAGLATGAVATGSAATIAAATAASAAGGSASIVGSFLVVSARVALLNAIFWAVVNSVFVVVPPGDPLPGYVYSNGPGPGPGPGPATVPPPPPLVFGNGYGGSPPPYSVPVPSPVSPQSPPSPPSPVSPPSPPSPPSAPCGAGDIAYSCVGECGMCIYDPNADAPNCCCDAECGDFGDCCGDLGTCCGDGDRTWAKFFEGAGRSSPRFGPRRVARIRAEPERRWTKQSTTTTTTNTNADSNATANVARRGAERARTATVGTSEGS